MKGKQKSTRSSPKLGLKNEDQTSTAPEPPRESNYNPHIEKDGPEAKLWELLRCNPWFQQCAHELSKLNLAKADGKQQFNEKFQKLDALNPFAGFALRWLFRPRLLNFNFPPWSKSSSELMALGFPWIQEDWLEMLEVVHDILLAEKKGETFAGPLTCSPSSFCLDTPWPETPELFQLIFHWLWQDFEIDANRTIGDIKVDGKSQTVECGGAIKSNSSLHFVSGEVSGHDIIHGGDMRAVLQQSGAFFKNHKLFAVPKTVTTCKTEKVLKKRFAEMLEGMRFINIQKYPGFLGSENDWLVFNYCRQRIIYVCDPKNSNQQFQRTGFGKAICDLIKAQNKAGKWKKEAKWDTLAKNYYEKMEVRMYAVFPVFDFARLLKSHLNVDLYELVSNMSVTALNGARKKVQFITTSFPTEPAKSS